jgi:hypothetical protein
MNMNRFLGLIMAATFFVAAPMVMAQEHSDHIEVGAFAEYLRFDQTTPTSNFVGLGGRAAVNLNSSVQLEAEMGYDFKRNFTNTFSDGVTTQFVNSNFRTLHGYFGPKFQTGSGAFRFFVTGKVGFENFTVNNQNAPAGFQSAIGLDNGMTDFAVYPGAGIEAFAGPIGLRLEAGDDIYFDHGAHNNLRVSFGPQFRF